MTPMSLTWLARGTDAPATSMKVRSPSDFSRGLVPRQIASVLDGEQDQVKEPAVQRRNALLETEKLARKR